ncbi:MAG: hypothetical protein RRB13_02620 [bacterium]|nr:hypothetical protein [bacterium]
MGKWAHDNMMDFGLDHLKQNGQRIIVCQGQPATYNEAITAIPAGKRLGDLGLTPVEFTLSNGATTGRRVTVAAQSVQISYSGTMDHIAIVDDSHSRLLYVWPITASQVVVGGNQVDTPDFDATIADPI